MSARLLCFAYSLRTHICPRAHPIEFLFILMIIWSAAAALQLCNFFFQSEFDEALHFIRRNHAPISRASRGTQQHDNYFASPKRIFFFFSLCAHWAFDTVHFRWNTFLFLSDGQISLFMSQLQAQRLELRVFCVTFQHFKEDYKPSDIPFRTWNLVIPRNIIRKVVNIFSS